MRGLLWHLLDLPEWQAMCLLALLPLLEASTLFGVLVPGETALVIGGVLAYQGQIGLPSMLVAGSMATVVGDSVGYFVGHRWGERLLHTRFARRIAERRWDRARRHLRTGGFAAVMFGRFGPVVRSLIPMLAGAARMPYARFLTANLIGGVCWAVAAILLGWAAGAAWERVHWVVLAVGVCVLAGMLLIARGGQRFRPHQRSRRRMPAMHA